MPVPTMVGLCATWPRTYGRGASAGSDRTGNAVKAIRRRARRRQEGCVCVDGGRVTCRAPYTALKTNGDGRWSECMMRWLKPGWHGPGHWVVQRGQRPIFGLELVRCPWSTCSWAVQSLMTEWDEGRAFEHTAYFERGRGRRGGVRCGHPVRPDALHADLQFRAGMCPKWIVRSFAPRLLAGPSPDVGPAPRAPDGGVGGSVTCAASNGFVRSDRQAGRGWVRQGARVTLSPAMTA